jgi:ankyrin repeat protein
VREGICLRHGLVGIEECGEVLRRMAESGDVLEVSRLIVARVTLDERDASGRTALLLASMKGHTQIVEVLIAAGAQLDLQDDISCRTALMLAAVQGHKQTAEALIVARALLDLQDSSGCTSLTLAHVRWHTKIAAALIAAGAQE